MPISSTLACAKDSPARADCLLRHVLPAGAKAIAEALPCCLITDLNLSQCKVGKAGASLAAPAAATLPGLYLLCAAHASVPPAAP